MILNFGINRPQRWRVRSSAVGSAALASGAGSGDKTEVGPEEWLREQPCDCTKETHSS
jgi:hypothetical protein